MSRPHSQVVYRGPSRFDPAETIRAVLVLRSRNRKTGDMAQLYVLHDNIPPTDAQATGHDSAVCGACALARDRGGSQGARAATRGVRRRCGASCRPRPSPRKRGRPSHHGLHPRASTPRDGRRLPPSRTVYAVGREPCRGSCSGCRGMALLPNTSREFAYSRRGNSMPVRARRMHKLPTLPRYGLGTRCQEYQR